MLHSINMLRTFSCFGIALYHIMEFVYAHSDTVKVSVSAGPGFHLFIAISGFILVFIARPGDTPVNFMMKRAIRIVPLYWLITTIALAMSLARPWLFQKADTSLSSIVSSYLFLPHYDLGGHIQPILFVGWTLGFIMFFYLLFSLSLLAPRRLQFPTVIVLTLGVIGASRLLPPGAYRTFYGSPILLEFAMGCVVGLSLQLPALQAFIRRFPMWPVALLGLVGFFIAAQYQLSDWGKIAIFAPSSTLILIACAGQDLFRTPLKSDIMLMGGKISYGVFLIHPLLVTPFGVVIFKMTSNDWLATILMIMTILPVTSLLAYLSFRYFETSAAIWLRGALRLSKTRTMPAGSVKPGIGPSAV